jgi:glycosyl transferase family 11
MNSGSTSLVVCKLPKAGLGNQLFPLLKALIFADINNLPVKVIGYHQFKIGPYLRGEKSKRKYSGYFTFQRNFFAEKLDTFFIKRKEGKYKVVNEPALEKVAESERSNCLYVFDQIPHWANFFEGLREHRDKAIQLFWNVLNKQIKQDLEKLPVPGIGVHIRMGDFRKLKAGEEFSKVGSVRTPEDYFIEVIKQLRAMHGSCLPVSVFTDGYEHELKELLSLEKVAIIQGNTDIVDLLLLSRSKIVVTSAGSTFSYWSGFLSNAPIIMHPDHIHESVRAKNDSVKYYEGPIHNEVLPEIIKKIS